jgi:hypothetical protein
MQGISKPALREWIFMATENPTKSPQQGTNTSSSEAQLGLPAPPHTVMLKGAGGGAIALIGRFIPINGRQADE